MKTRPSWHSSDTETSSHSRANTWRTCGLPPRIPSCRPLWRPVLLPKVLLPWLAHAAEAPCACLRSLAPLPLTARAVQEEQGVAIAQARTDREVRGPHPRLA